MQLAIEDPALRNFVVQCVQSGDMYYQIIRKDRKRLVPYAEEVRQFCTDYQEAKESIVSLHFCWRELRENLDRSGISKDFPDVVDQIKQRFQTEITALEACI